MIDNQLGRRNSTPEGISYLRGLRYKNEKLQHGGNRKSSGNDFNLQKTSDMLGEQYKVTGRTIVNDEKFADAIETIAKTFPTPLKQKDIKHKILTRQFDISKKDLVELSELSAKYIKQVLDGEKELWQVKLDIEQTRKKKKKKQVRVVLPDEIKMYCGDCVDVMKKMESDTYSSAVLDPPYGWPLGKNKKSNFSPAEIDRYGLIEQAYFVGDRSPALKAGLYDLSMEGGKKYQKWCSEWGKELLRVIKPGGHVLVFCSTRMLHRLTIGMELSGWEVRNILTWVFGTGFPTSISLSQQIDKLKGKNSRSICENPNRKNRLNWDCNQKSIYAPATSEAEKYENYYSQIKNSFEPILLLRKPLSEKTIAENTIKWGVGALNIGETYIGNQGGAVAVNIKKGEGRRIHGGGISNIVDVQSNGKGRFPSNVILSSEAGEALMGAYKKQHK
jgi:DNA modification methylase